MATCQNRGPPVFFIQSKLCAHLLFSQAGSFEATNNIITLSLEGRKMDKTKTNNNANAITRLLERISNGENPKKLRREATRLMSDVQPVDIARAEQNLIESGISESIVHNLSSAFMLMGILEDQILNIKAKLPNSHIIRKVIAEHDLTRCYLADLDDLTKEIDEMEKITDVSLQFRRLTHLIEHLDAMEEHIEREEDVIFPMLKKHGWKALCRASQSDHVYIRIAIGDLVKLIASFKQSKTDEFKIRLKSITKYLCPRMKDHFFQEENILYPIALELIRDKNIWHRMKDVCEEIGYCGVHV